MSMFSEIATEATIHCIVKDIQKLLNHERHQDPAAQAALKEAGLCALQHFEWDTPEWAKEFKELFK